MQIEEFLAPRILIVSGKGGVGKTTISAALALVAARQGRRVCLAEVDRKGTLPRLFGAGHVGYEPTELVPEVWGMNILPEDALAEYLDVQYHMKRIARIFTSTQFVDYITTAAPGLKDILVLGKIWFLEQGRGSGRDRRTFDTIVVDAPAAGHMLTFLSAPIGLSDAVRVGPVKRQADWLIEMLRDPTRCRVHIVTLAEEMPVSETLETAGALNDRLDITTGPIFANAIYPEIFSPRDEEMLDELISDDHRETLAAKASDVAIRLDAQDLDAIIDYSRFVRARRSIQEQHLTTLRDSVSNSVVELPYLFASSFALPEIEMMADAIEERVEKL